MKLNKYKLILRPFIITRLILFLLIFLSQYFAANKFHQPVEEFNRGWKFIPNIWLDSWGRWDSGWYMSIVKDGYLMRETWAFFPLYSLIIKFLSLPFKASIHNYLLIGIIFSNICLLFSLFIMFDLVKKITHKEKIAKLAIWFLLLFPTAFILSTFYAEVLFLTLSLATFLFIEKDKPIWASVLAGLATITRPPGFILIFPLLYYLISKTLKDKKIKLKYLLALMPIPASLLTWLYYAKTKTDNFLLPLIVQNDWGRKAAMPWQTLFGPSEIINEITILEKIIVLIFLALTIALYFWKKDKKYFLYTAIMILFPLFTGSLMSISRHLLMLFPIFIYLATLSEKNTFIEKIISLSFWTIQVAFFIGWCRFYWIV